MWLLHTILIKSQFCFLVFVSIFLGCCGFQQLSYPLGRQSLQTSIAYTGLFVLMDTKNLDDIDSQTDDWITPLDPEIYGKAFLQRLRELQTFKDTYGHCLVPKRFKANPTLGNFVNKVRQQWRKYDMGEKSSITLERISVLDQMGFRWDGRFSTETPCHSIQVKHNSLWLNRFQELKEFIDKNKGDLHKLSSDSPLGSWASRQRIEKKKYDLGEKTTLTEERIRYLDSIHFCWAPREKLWELRVQELKEFKEQYGHCVVPTQYTKNPQLGNWICSQRKLYKAFLQGAKNDLNEERIKLLTAMGFVWSRWEWNSEERQDDLNDLLGYKYV